MFYCDKMYQFLKVLVKKTSDFKLYYVKTETDPIQGPCHA